MHFKVRRSAAAALPVGYLIFPQISTILSNPTPPQTLSLGQLKPHCVNPATSIRITNKLSLTVITIVLPCPLIVRAHLQPASPPPHLCVLRELCVEIPPSPVYLHLASLGIPAPRLYAFSEASVPKSFEIGTLKILSFRTIIDSKSFRMNTYEKGAISSHLSPFRMNTYEKQGGGGPVLLTKNPTKDLYPERPPGVKDLSSNPQDRRFRPGRKGFLSRLPPSLSGIFILFTDHCPLTTAHFSFKSFSCNTYGSPRKCCKQKTYSPAKPFRCNTYKKQGASC